MKIAFMNAWYLRLHLKQVVLLWIRWAGAHLSILPSSSSQSSSCHDEEILPSPLDESYRQDYVTISGPQLSGRDMV